MKLIHVFWVYYNMFGTENKSRIYDSFTRTLKVITLYYSVQGKIVCDAFQWDTHSVTLHCKEKKSFVVYFRGPLKI